MTSIRQLPRYGTLWILLGYIAAVIPLLRYLPPWLVVLAIAAVGWRLLIFRGKTGLPGRQLKLVLLVFCITGLLISFPKPYGLEPMVTLLVIAYSLKLLEMKDRRDALLALFLGIFVAILLALFDQGVLTGLYILASLSVLVAGLMGINQSDFHSQYLRPLRSALVIVAQALPLMMVLFLVLPRLGALWAVPGIGEGARTGMSDSMSPGDISQLSQSAEIAFRVEFDGPLPPRNQLYWRGMTFSGFDGRRWSRAEGWEYGPNRVAWYGEPAPDWLLSRQGNGAPIDYEVVIEPTFQHWLYSLDRPQASHPRTGVMRDFTLVTPDMVDQRIAYTARSWLSAPMDLEGLPELRQGLELQFPAGANPQTQRVARQWAAQAGSSRALIQRVLALYSQHFYYTMSPPSLGRHAIDEFLWQTRTGFCEHFASSFVFFMRAAGIPARVVVGYQGGEWNPKQRYLTVRQYDAHAWAEVWLEGEGWMRVDPTAAVAPERIDRSVLESLGLEDDLLADTPLSLAHFRDIPFLNTLRLQLDYLEYSWGKWVLGYNNHQVDLLTGLLGKVDYVRVALLLSGAGLVALLPVVFFSFRRLEKDKKHPLDQQYLVFCRKLARAGLVREPGESPGTFAQRSARVLPGNADEIFSLTSRYLELRFAPGEPDIELFRQQVKKFDLKKAAN